MCYFSLENPTRKAHADEVLLVERLSRSRKGLVAPEDGSTVVCLSPGIRLELLFIPDSTRRRYGLQLEERATFKVRHWLRRDMLLLDCGRLISFQSLEIGQVVRILSDTTDLAPKPSTPGVVIETVEDSVGPPRTKY